MLITVGHGTLEQEELLRLLTSSSIEELVDVRTYPGSRRHPQFSRQAMEAWVPAGGISYRWAPALGGRRRPGADSPNVALRNPSFRAYADHMATAEFRDALATLVDDADAREVAVMCAESVWWRCHRRLIADAAVLLHRREVRHLFHDGRLRSHGPSPEARIASGDDGAPILVYDLGAERPLFE
jgi:uncharacterized protein (DUF488 family)